MNLSVAFPARDVHSGNNRLQRMSMHNGPTRRWRITAPLVWLLCCAWAAGASGSCGDYLYTKHSKPSHAHQQAQAATESAGQTLSMAHAGRHEGFVPSRPATPAQRGCTGPGCRRLPGPATHERFSGGLTTHSSDGRAASHNGRASRTQALAKRRPDSETSTHAGFRGRIERPPQRVSRFVPCEPGQGSSTIF